MKRTSLTRYLSTLAILLSLVAPLRLPSSAYAAGAQQAVERRATAAAAQKPATQPAAATAAPQTQLVSRVLANGLEVVVLEDHSIPLVSLELAVKNGSYTEPPELNGLSHLYEHMFFKANKAVLDEAEYLKTLDQLGILMNASTREEIVNYYLHTTSPNLRVAMNYMRDAIRYPLFNERQFEQERQAVLGELDRHESNPYGFLGIEMNNRLFYKYPSRKNPSGNRETVTNATTDTMRLIQSRYYIPNNSAFIVTGDAKPEEVFKLAQELFGDWRKGDDPFVKYPLVEHPPLAKSEGAVIKQPVNNVIINIGWQGPSIGKDNAATYAADVFSYILQQPDSRFQRALVDTGLITGGGINYYTQRNVGPIQITVQTTPDKARAALRAIYKEVAAFNEPSYYTDEQLEAAKGLLEAEDLYQREKLSEYTHIIGFWWASTGLDYFRGYLANLRRTSRADITRYVTTYIQGKSHVGLALLSEEAQREVQLTPQDLIGEGAK
ncbi:MAG TPA: pitrilysin family protein [Pyrinomonadaceae bacterium]|nr:pitrilysin family protein [Pyrinomonadaceae bacterium]